MVMHLPVGIRAEDASLEPVSLANTFGAFLICTFLGCTLFGLTTHQTYRYFRLYPSDGWLLKGLVTVLWCLDAIHTITSIHVCYHYLVLNYADPAALAIGEWSIRVGIVQTGAIMFVAHSFYARRLFLLSDGNFFPAITIIILLLAEMGFALGATIETFLQVTFARFFSYTWTIWGVLSCAVLVDLVATSILIHYLRQSRTGFRRTDSMVDILMVYAINTGLSTSILTFAALICAIVLPHTLIWAAMTVVGTKMYANSLLAVVNSRRSLIDRGMEGFETGSFGLQVVDPNQVASARSYAHGIELPRAQRRHNVHGLQRASSDSLQDITKLPAAALTPAEPVPGPGRSRRRERDEQWDAPGFAAST